MKYELTPQEENCLKCYRLYENGKPGFEPDCPNVKFDVIMERGAMCAEVEVILDDLRNAGQGDKDIKHPAILERLMSEE